jgi:hypothetical protein
MLLPEGDTQQDIAHLALALCTQPNPPVLDPDAVAAGLRAVPVLHPPSALPELQAGVAAADGWLGNGELALAGAADEDALRLPVEEDVVATAVGQHPERQG